MVEPPAKRPRRTDSSTMWEMSDSRNSDRTAKDVDGPSKRETTPREDSRRAGDYRDDRRDDRRRRSRSRDRGDRRRERSRSRERWGRDGRDSRRDIDRSGRGTRDRDRSTSRDRKYSRRDYPHKSGRYRDQSPTRSRTRSRSPRGPTKLRTRSPPRASKSERRDAGRDRRPRDDGRETNGVSESKRRSSKADPVEDMDIDHGDEASLERQMLRTMGFSSFRSTQNTKVPGNNVYGVRKEKKSEYRQYMNRVGGFNRPLSPSR